jgi:anti-anti-sigma factor
VPTDFDAALRVDRQRLAGATVISAEGEVDQTTVRALRRSLDRVAPGSGPLILDLSGVTFFGSAGVACLVDVRRRTRTSRIDLRLTCSPVVARMLDVTGVGDQVVVFDSVDAALAEP